MTDTQLVSRDFDAERAPSKTMRLRGYVFTLLPDVHPNAMAEWNEYSERIAKDRDSVPEAEAITNTYKIIRACLIPIDRDAFDTLCAADGEEMLGLFELSEKVVPWVLEQITGRPFERSATSTPTPLTPTSPTPSTAGSDSPPAEDSTKPRAAFAAS